MSKVMTASQLVAKAVDIAKNYKTLYVMGAFGAPLTEANKERYCKNHEYNRRPARQELIRAASSDTFAFDCVNLIKGILWSWSGDLNAPYGGATYASNGVPDIDADQMINRCSEVSANFANIKPGEMLWKSGHAGIYIGDGLGVECTPAWYDKVQITAVGNIGRVSGYNVRTWSKHGKLPWVDYNVKQEEPILTEKEVQALIDKAVKPLKEKIAEQQITIDKGLGRFIHDINDVPDGLKGEVRRLLDCGAVNGGTTAEENPDDLNMFYQDLRVAIINARYADYINEHTSRTVNFGGSADD